MDRDAPREFRTILFHLRKYKQKSAISERRLVGHWIRRINQALGNPWRFQVALRGSLRGVAEYGAAVAKAHGIGRANQFVHLFTDIVRYGTPVNAFYLFRFYLPQYRLDRPRHFPIGTQGPILRALRELASPTDVEALESKTTFANRCREHSLPTPEILAEFENGAMTVGVTPFPMGDLFSKPADWAKGHGVRLWRDGTFSSEELIANLCQQSSDRGCCHVLQPRLKNHPGILPLTNGALSTLRIVTCKNPAGEIESLPAVIRMPHGNSLVDNFGQGGMAAPIDANGLIKGHAIKKDSGLGAIVVERHPDTGTLFEGFQIPFWNESLALAKRAHRAFPSMVFIGWDIPILSDGPKLLEGNVIWDTDLTVLAHGLTLSDTQYVPYCNFYLRNRVHVLGSTLWPVQKSSP